MFRARCLLFGEARAQYQLLTKRREDYVDLEIPLGTTSVQLLSKLRDVYGDFGQFLDISVLAINQEYVPIDAAVVIQPTDEVAVIPPVSGG